MYSCKERLQTKDHESVKENMFTCSGKIFSSFFYRVFLSSFFFFFFKSDVMPLVIWGYFICLKSTLQDVQDVDW